MTMKYVYCCLLGRDAIQSDTSLSTFQSNFLLSILHLSTLKLYAKRFSKKFRKYQPDYKAKHRTGFRYVHWHPRLNRGHLLWLFPLLRKTISNLRSQHPVESTRVHAISYMQRNKLLLVCVLIISCHVEGHLSKISYGSSRKWKSVSACLLC